MKRKRKSEKEKETFINYRVIPILVIAVVLLLSIGYSALETNIFMELTANFEPHTDIRITGITLNSASSDAYSTSEKYVKDNVSIGVYLPNSDSEVLYNIEITNFEEPIAGILKITQSNEDLDVNITDYDFGTALCDLDGSCNLGSVSNITLSVKYKDGHYSEESDKNYNTVVNFDFRGFVDIAYSNMNIEGLPTSIMEGDTYSFNLNSKGIADVYITDSSRALVETVDYTFNNKVLTIDQVSDNINIAGVIETVNAPNLYNSDLVPVVYNGYNWVVADTNTSWYDYGSGNWANAVILGNTDDGNGGTVRITKSVGDTVDVDGASGNCEILGMFVWIPRFSYTIKNDGVNGNYGRIIDGVNASSVSSQTPGAIDIRFISTSSKEVRSATYDYSPINFTTHPAFTIYNEDDSKVELDGIWVAKFLNSDNNGEERIVPNVAMDKDAFSNAITKATSFSTYLSNSIPHLLKNSEWDAVSLLSQSIYGKYGNSSYSDADKEVYFNNSLLYYTGRSSGTYSGNIDAASVYPNEVDPLKTTSYGYYTYNGDLLDYNLNTLSGTSNASKVASTTGNIYGVYDMNTLCSEYVSMFNLTNLEKKYYDTFATSNCLSGVCFGHLTSTSGYYSDKYLNGLSTNIILRNNVNVNDSAENGIFAFGEASSLNDTNCYRTAIFKQN